MNALRALWLYICRFFVDPEVDAAITRYEDKCNE